MDSKIRILLIEDDPDDVLLIREMLSKDKASFEVTVETTLEAGLDRMEKGDAQLTLLDLSLPDSRGLETFLRVRDKAPSMPVVVLTGLDDGRLALEAARLGAQDYLVKGTVTAPELTRTLRYAVTRHRSYAELKSLALIDDVTGLYNRRGFLTMGEQYLKLALRTRLGLGVILVRLDEPGRQTAPHERDLTLIRAAKTLRDTVRQSDIAAYFGEGLFVALTMESAAEKTPCIRERVVAGLKKSFGASGPAMPPVKTAQTYHDPEMASDRGLAELLDEAGKSLLPS